jgi:hypothetical protein
MKKDFYDGLWKGYVNTRNDSMRIAYNTNKKDKKKNEKDYNKFI